jgi:hypothetical protein
MSPGLAAHHAADRHWRGVRLRVVHPAAHVRIEREVEVLHQDFAALRAWDRRLDDLEIAVLHPARGAARERHLLVSLRHGIPPRRRVCCGHARARSAIRRRHATAVRNGPRPPTVAQTSHSHFLRGMGLVSDLMIPLPAPETPPRVGREPRIGGVCKLAHGLARFITFPMCTVRAIVASVPGDPCRCRLAVGPGACAQVNALKHKRKLRHKTTT